MIFFGRLGNASAEEVEIAISQLKRNRTTASDALSAEMLMTEPEENIHILTTPLACRTHNEIPRPGSWSGLMAILLPKVQAAAQCKDFRPITLVPVLMKFYCRILLNRLVILRPRGSLTMVLGAGKGTLPWTWYRPSGR